MVLCLREILLNAGTVELLATMDVAFHSTNKFVWPVAGGPAEMMGPEERQRLYVCRTVCNTFKGSYKGGFRVSLRAASICALVVFLRCAPALYITCWLTAMLYGLRSNRSIALDRVRLNRSFAF